MSLAPEDILLFEEDLERYTPARPYLDVVTPMLGSSYRLTTGGPWAMATSPSHADREQGFKLHVSSALGCAEDTLRRVVPVAVAHEVSFKFLADPYMLARSLGKNAPRTQVGKFAALYPNDDSTFMRVADALKEALRDLIGPHVLTDRAYKNSKVLFYRYGAHRGLRRASPRGPVSTGFLTPEGDFETDERRPYFWLPPWVRDPVSANAPPARPSDGVLLNARYQARAALKFSAFGGIYLATDTHSGATVVVREARPFVGPLPDDSDARDLIRREANILRLLAGTGLAPELVDEFTAEDHAYLVESFVEGNTLWQHALGFYFRRNTELSPAESFASLRETMLSLIRGLRVIHEKGIVLRDLTRTNVLVHPSGSLTFIDFEFAHVVHGADPWVSAFTQGYASPNQRAGGQPKFCDDHYALGALLLDTITFAASGFALNRSGILRALDINLRDMRLPAALKDVVLGLCDLDETRRWDLERAETFLREITPPADTRALRAVDTSIPVASPDAQRLRAGTTQTLLGILRAITMLKRPQDERALFPGTRSMFASNPISLQYGALGPLFLLLRATGSVPEDLIEWLRSAARRSLSPPGLYSGVLGLALFHLERGAIDEGREVLSRVSLDDLSHPGLYFGKAGFGLTHLHFWRRVHDEKHLRAAVAVGEALLAAASQHDEHGACWQTEGVKYIGLGEGASGVALFLLYLHAATGEARYLYAARRAIDFDLSYGERHLGIFLCPPSVDAPASAPKSPHTHFGTCGIGAAVVRAAYVTQAEDLVNVATEIARTASTRQTNKLWQDEGLAGFGEYLLDCHRFLNDERYLAQALGCADALLVHGIDRFGGVVFAGRELDKISLEFGSGTSGVGMFLNRLVSPSCGRLLFLDELLRPHESPR